jgi:hypothetical protein
MGDILKTVGLVLGTLFGAITPLALSQDSRTDARSHLLLLVPAAAASAEVAPETVSRPEAPVAIASTRVQNSDSQRVQMDQQNAGDAQKKTSDDSLKKAEHQRIFGVIPEFQAVNHESEYKPLTAKQKFHLMWRSSTDPYPFGLDAIIAGIGQARNSNPGFGQGTQGYFKRLSATYADTIDGNFWGNAVLTSLLHENPRYFRKGEDFSYTHRALYSASTAVWTHRDSGSWGPNYANVLGNIIAGGISNFYYPSSDRGVGNTLSGALTVTAEGIIGSELEEFWPDIARHIGRKRQALSSR